MTQQRSTTIIIFIALLSVFCLWLIFGSGKTGVSANTLASYDQTEVVNDSQFTNESSALLIRDNGLNEKLAERFRLTVEYIEKGQNERAIAELNEIIRQQPTAIEPYINLASVYANSNEFELASETLKKAIGVNQNTSILFQGLQEVYAAQAALAYQNALEENKNDASSIVLDLPVINTLMVDKPSDIEQGLISSNETLQIELTEKDLELKLIRQNLAQALKEKNELIESSSEVSQVAQVSNDELQEIVGKNAQLQEQLQQVENEISNLKNAYEAQLDELKKQSEIELIALQKQSEAKLLEVQKQSEAALILMRQELDLQTEKIAKVEVEQTDDQVVLSSLEPQTLASVEPVSVDEQAVAEQVNEQTVESAQIEQVEASPLENTTSDDAQEKDQVAIDLVKSWAKSWSAQDVESYVQHYESEFRPSSGISNKQWREQRQVRLTNKTYIKVKVYDFKVKEEGDQFSVRFFQHYQSNNVDDTIVKELVFKKVNADWSEAKIVQENVVSS